MLHASDTLTTRILCLVANPATATTTGWPVGFWASELTHAWWALEEAGFRCSLASLDGGPVQVDALSDPGHESGYSAQDHLSRGFLASPVQAALLRDTPRAESLDLAPFAALYLAGGQSPMFTWRARPELTRLVRAFLDARRPVVAVCHGVAGLLDVTTPEGGPLLAGRYVTGFCNSEEDAVDALAGRRVMPFRIEDEARKLGARFAAAPAFAPNAVRDGLLITGQQQNSARRAAELLIETLGTLARGQ
jgi:putative intracellular protease/amidase